MRGGDPKVTQKTKRSMMPTLLLVAVVAGALFVLPKVFSLNGSRDDMVLLQVAWEPSPRQIHVDYAIGTGDTKVEHPAKGSWGMLIPAKPGTVVYLAAFQDSPGTLICRTKRGGKELAHDTNAGRTGQLANAVKCISGG